MTLVIALRYANRRKVILASDGISMEYPPLEEMILSKTTPKVDYLRDGTIVGGAGKIEDTQAIIGCYDGQYGFFVPQYLRGEVEKITPPPMRLYAIANLYLEFVQKRRETSGIKDEFHEPNFEFLHLYPEDDQIKLARITDAGTVYLEEACDYLSIGLDQQFRVIVQWEGWNPQMSEGDSIAFVRKVLDFYADRTIMVGGQRSITIVSQKGEILQGVVVE